MVIRDRAVDCGCRNRSRACERALQQCSAAEILLAKERAKRQPNMGRFRARIRLAINCLGEMWLREIRDLELEHKRAVGRE